MQRPVKWCLMLAAVAGLGACAPEVVPATSHLATTPDQVKIYQKQPAKYERLGIVKYLVTSTTQWQENGDATPAFNDLIAKANALGANGLLLIDDSNASTVLAGARFRGMDYLVPVQRDPKTVIVQAIYVIKE